MEGTSLLFGEGSPSGSRFANIAEI